MSARLPALFFLGVMAAVSASCDKAPVTITVRNETGSALVLRVDDGRYEREIEADATAGLTLDVNYKPRVIEVIPVDGANGQLSRWEFSEKTDDFDDLEITIR